MDYSGRIAQLRLAMQKARCDALLVTHLPNVRYLCGFTGSAGVLLLSSRSFFFTDGRYAEQAAKEVVGAKVVITKSPALTAAAKQAGRMKRGHLGIEADHLSVTAAEAVADALPKGVRLASTRSIVEQLRMIKEPVEIELLRAAIDLGCELLPVAQKAIRPGGKEVEVAAKLEFAARKAGAQAMSFETIVAAGPRSALPHGVASEAPIPANGFVVLDYGVILHGYCSDMTRTVHVGRADQEERDLYRAVLDAQLAAIAACLPGAKLTEVDSAARDVLKQAKLDKFFTHSTGHGVGLEIHELPRVAQGQKEILRPGMVITIEPGIYQAGKRGIRIEDVVAITETGYDLLTSARKELIEI
ncbi:MAG: Xaa-Pro peptidase family protein [Terriglobia bacterium]|nr:Xaa-Pro peptidase family protein [Terriglobia bacterium]